MTVGAYGRTSVAVARAVDQFTTSRNQLSTQQDQLTSGRAASSYSALGIGASRSLGLRSQLANLESYKANIADAGVRLGLMSAGIAHADKMGQSLVTGLSETLDVSKYGATGYVASAADGLQQLITTLNESVNGRYLYSGRAADTKPVADYGLILDGDADHIGLRQLISERKAADLGADGLGRLEVSTTGTTSTLAESAANLPFGFKLTGATASGAGVTPTFSGTPPASASFAVGAQPNAGDEVAVTLQLQDGSSRTVRLTAGTANSDTGFAIGATAADTAANISAALGLGVGALASTALAAGSAMAATENFFASTADDPPLRVDPLPPATATGLVADPTVVQWYRGDLSASPREGTPVRIGDGETIGIGAQAREPAFRTALAAFAVLAAEDFTPVTVASQGRYTELAASVKASLSAPAGGTLREIAADMAIAAKNLGTAKTRVTAAENQARNALSDVEDADPTETAAKLLATQTRLQASYQITATVLKLSIVDYI